MYSAESKYSIVEYPPAEVLGSVPAPMLARLERTLPKGELWRYEPKFDGFRGLIWRATSGSVHLFSRNLKDLGASFPELATAGQSLPPGTVLDGEIVIADSDGFSNFGALQERLGAGKRGAATAADRTPAVLLAFDVLRDTGIDVTGMPLCLRRERLEALLSSTVSNLQLIAQTGSLAEAEDWLNLVPGIEGVVAKRTDSRYLSGQRDWVKVKRSHSVDCAVIGFAGDPATPKLVLGLRHGDVVLHHFAVSRPLTHEAAAALRAALGFAVMNKPQSDRGGSTMRFLRGVPCRRVWSAKSGCRTSICWWEVSTSSC